ncbi:MAG: DnaJ domain-containing protein, partial [Nitrospira sp.]|nr:DnaJ domain-containing protein [Nitrospira sp.]
MDILPSGRLHSTKLPILIRYLQQGKKTGILTLRRNDQERSLCLKSGDIIFATSKYEDDRLGEMLLKSGRITLEQYETSVVLLRTTSKRQGTILVEQGYITPRDLFTTVLIQVKEIILSLFTWIDGDYQFAEGDLPSDEVITLKMSTGNLILDGIKRINDWTRLSKEIPPWNSILQISTDPKNLFQDIELTSLERNFLKSIDGKKTARDLFKNTPLPPLATLQMIYFLFSVGIVEIVTYVSMPDQATEPVPPSQLQESQMEEKAKVEKAILKAVLQEKRADVEDSQDDIFQKVVQENLANREKIRQAYETMSYQDHYQILNLRREATRDDIKRAYFHLAKEYHPDRHLQEGMEDMQEYMEALFRRITEAYDTLLTEKTRKEYDLFLAMGPAHQKRGPSVESTFSPEQQAAQLYERAKEAFKQGDMGQVVYCMEWVLRLGSEKAGHHALLGQALMTMPSKLREAEQAFQKAIQLDPANPAYYINLGLIYKKGGMKSRALD